MRVVFLFFLLLSFQIFGQQKLVKGASFADRFIKIESKHQNNNVWGAANVIPRDTSNGIEDENYSYWGGNIVHGDDGKEHLFVARWPENISRPNGKSGHNLWWASEVVHAISDDPMGPYKVVSVVGKGHNPEIYRLKDGSYIIGVMGAKAYKSKTLTGPWVQIKTSFDFIDKEQNKTNRTYVVKGDGSVLMMNKEGYLFISKNADEHFKELKNTPRAFVRTKGAHEEDPVIWKDEVQYNLIMNDAFGRKAYHLTSKDGIHNWTFEDGIAYSPEVVKNVSASLGNWWKLERPKIRQDKYGRATHINFAAIDTLKNYDLANDKHSSKNIVLPLMVPKRLQILDREEAVNKRPEIVVKILAEEGFNPVKDIAIKTLCFGNSYKVNRGKGAKVLRSEVQGNDLVLIFRKKDMGISLSDYKVKILGKTKKGQIFMGYALLNNSEKSF